jgi:25S rRNA (adenine2142-N1)-methyltransferase
MKRKRKLFTGVVPIGGPSVKSRRLARKITSKFHELNNKLGDTKNSEEIANIEQEIELLGGRNRYQEASVVTTSHHKTSKWVVSTLQRLGVYPRGRKSKLNTLEIGAVNIQLHQYPALKVRSIDINSQVDNHFIISYKYSI